MYRFNKGIRQYPIMDNNREEKKAEVRKKLAAMSRNKVNRTPSTRFMTPERKKKLRVLLRKAAARKIAEETDAKMAERRKVIEQRVGQPRKTEGLSESELRSLCKEYYQRVCVIEDKNYDLEKEVENKDYQINELDFQVHDFKGKFVKPSLKKVTKHENKFAKLQKEAAKYNFRNQLKTVKKQEYTLKEEYEGEHDKPDWALQKDGRSKSMASMSEGPRLSESEPNRKKSSSSSSGSEDD